MRLHDMVSTLCTRVCVCVRGKNEIWSNDSFRLIHSIKKRRSILIACIKVKASLFFFSLFSSSSF